MNQRLFNCFVNFFEQRTLNDLINIMRNVNWKLSFNSFKDFNNRDISFFIEKINQDIFFIEKINQFKKNRNDKINKKTIKFNNNIKKLIENWSQWLIDKIKKIDWCWRCFKKNHRYNNKNILCKNQSRLIAEQIKFKHIMLQCMNEKSLYLLNKYMRTLNDIDHENNVDIFFFKKQRFEKRLIFNKNFNWE